MSLGSPGALGSSRPLGGTRGLLRREIRRNKDNPQIANKYREQLSDMNIARGMRGDSLIGSSDSDAKEVVARRNLQKQQLQQGAGVATGSYEPATGDRLKQRKEIDAGIQGFAQKGELTGERLSDARKSAAGAGVSDAQFNAYLSKNNITATSPMAATGNEVPFGGMGGATGATGAPGVPGVPGAAAPPSVATGATVSSDEVAVGVPAMPTIPKLERAEEDPPEEAPYNPRPGYSGDIRGQADGRPLTIKEQIERTDVKDVLNRSESPAIGAPPSSSTPEEVLADTETNKAARDARFQANFEGPASGRLEEVVAARAEAGAEAAEAAEAVNVRDTMARNAAAIKEMGESMQQYRDSNVGRTPIEELSPEEYRRRLFAPRPEEGDGEAGPPSLIGGVPASQVIARSRQRVANRQAIARGEIPDLYSQDGETGYSDDEAKALRGQFYQDFEEKNSREAMLDELLERGEARNEVRAEQLGLSVDDYNKGLAEEARSISEARSKSQSISEPDFTDQAKALRKEKIISKNKQLIKEARMKDYVTKSMRRFGPRGDISEARLPERVNLNDPL